MAINDYDDLIPRYMAEMENYVVWAMENRINRDDLIEKIGFIILDVEETEEFTLRIIKGPVCGVFHEKHSVLILGIISTTIFTI